MGGARSKAPPNLQRPRMHRNLGPAQVGNPLARGYEPPIAPPKLLPSQSILRGLLARAGAGRLHRVLSSQRLPGGPRNAPRPRGNPIFTFCLLQRVHVERQPWSPPRPRPHLSSSPPPGPQRQLPLRPLRSSPPRSSAPFLDSRRSLDASG